MRTYQGAEVAPFRMTGIEGYALGRYWQDGSDVAIDASGPTPSGGNSNQKLTSVRGELFVMTHNYIYHPNLLLLDLGAGPVYFHDQYANNGVDGTHNETTYNLSARATFLREKPYRGSVYYDRTNDSYPVGPAQSLLTQTTRYGFDAALLSPVTPVPLYLDASRFHSKGIGTDQVQDEQIDEANFRAEMRWGTLGETQLHLQAIDDNSQSGSLSLPIQATRTRTDRGDLDTRLVFGDNSQHEFNNTVFAYKQVFTGETGTLADTSALRFDANLRTRLSDVLQTRARYQFDYVSQAGSSGADTNRLNLLNAGVTYQPIPNASGSLDAVGSYLKSTPLTSRQGGIGGTANYTYELPVGELAANYTFNWFQRDQTASEPIAPVVGEKVALPGTAWVNLRRPNVVQTSIVVSNAQRTQVFVLGHDYALQVIGLVTQIQRLAGGDIIDGQEVLVDYDYDTGGTYAINQFDNNVQVGWRWKNLFNIYVRYYDMAPHLISGSPTVPLNPMNDLTYGVRADVPFALLDEQMSAGGYAEWEGHREDVAPYTKTTYDAYLESTIPFIPRGGIRLGASQISTDYVYTPLQSNDTRTYAMRLWARFRSGINLTAEGTRTNVTGSPQVERQYWAAKLKALWRIRKVLLTLELNKTWESQMGTQTTHTLGQFTVRRDF